MREPEPPTEHVNASDPFTLFVSRAAPSYDDDALSLKPHPTVPEIARPRR